MIVKPMKIVLKFQIPNPLATPDLVVVSPDLLRSETKPDNFQSNPKSQFPNKFFVFVWDLVLVICLGFSACNLGFFSLCEITSFILIMADISHPVKTKTNGPRYSPTAL